VSASVECFHIWHVRPILLHPFICLFFSAIFTHLYSLSPPTPQWWVQCLSLHHPRPRHWGQLSPPPPSRPWYHGREQPWCSVPTDRQMPKRWGEVEDREQCLPHIVLNLNQETYCVIWLPDLMSLQLELRFCMLQSPGKTSVLPELTHCVVSEIAIWRRFDLFQQREILHEIQRRKEEIKEEKKRKEMAKQVLCQFC
jgi:hypothetical protein